MYAYVRGSGNGYGWTPTGNEGAALPRGGNEFGTRRYSEGDEGKGFMALGPGNTKVDSRPSCRKRPTVLWFIRVLEGNYTRERVVPVVTKNYGRSNYGEITNGATERFEELVGMTGKRRAMRNEFCKRAREKGYNDILWWFLKINDAGKLRDWI